MWEETWWWTDGLPGGGGATIWGGNGVTGRVMRARRHGRRPLLGKVRVYFWAETTFTGGDGVTDRPAEARPATWLWELKYTNNTLTVVVYLTCCLTGCGSVTFLLVDRFLWGWAELSGPVILSEPYLSRCKPPLSRCKHLSEHLSESLGENSVGSCLFILRLTHPHLVKRP